jgi:VWFA-related protein
MLTQLRFMCLAFAAAAGIVVMSRASAQQAPALAITAVDASSYPQITAVVTALDGNGVPVAGLTAADIQAFEGEAPLEVAELRTERLSLGVAVVIDVSGSMQGQAITAAKEAAQEFVRSLQPADTASVFAFSSDVRQVAPFTSDKAQLAAAIDGLQAAGDTSLFAATQAAVFGLAQVPAPRKAIVLLSDGADTSSPVTAQQALDAARAAHLPVYGIGFGPVPDTTFLQTIAQQTSGQYRAADAASIGAVYADITRLLDSEYTLTLRAAGDALPAGPSSLRIAAAIGGQPVEATAAFDRPGGAVPTIPVPSGAAAAAEDEGSSTPLLVYGSVVGAITLAVVLVLAAGIFQRTRTRRRQLAVVAPNLQQAAAQGVPHVSGIVIDRADGEGRLILLDGSPPPAYDFTSAPLRIGSGHDCEVRLPPSPEVAPRHAAVWMRDGKIMLRHTGGSRRPTLVNGRPSDWIILEHGDEFVVGPHRFRVERTS